MAFLKKYRLILVMAAIGLAALAAVGMLRALLIDAAHADLQTRGVVHYAILGARIPCSGPFDIGVSVLYRYREKGDAFTARLCRSPDWWERMEIASLGGGPIMGSGRKARGAKAAAQKTVT